MRKIITYLFLLVLSLLSIRIQNLSINNLMTLLATFPWFGTLDSYNHPHAGSHETAFYPRRRPSLRRAGEK